MNAIESTGELTRVYARLFLHHEDGARVLADLKAKFNPCRPRFPFKQGESGGQLSTHYAAWIDGQCSVLREIERAIAAGAAREGPPAAAAPAIPES